MPEAPKTWILTGSPENFDATRGDAFRLIGMLRKARRRNQAREVEPGDRIVLHLTRLGRFAGSVGIAGLQGRLRTVSDADAALLLDRLRAAAGVPA